MAETPPHAVHSVARWIVRTLASLLGLLGIILILAMAWLVYPARPGDSRTLHFEGFILLPQHGVLNVLDYLTLDGRALYVTGASSGSVFRISLPQGGGASGARVEAHDGEPRVHGVAVDEAAGLAFVTRSEVNAVDALALSDLHLVKRIAVAADPDSILYDAHHDLIYAANGDEHAATPIDPEKLAKLPAIALGGKPEFEAVDPRSGLLYQNLVDTSEIVSVDLGRRRVTARFPLAPCQGPTGIAIDPSTKRAFIVCGKNATLVVFDLVAHRVVASLGIGSGPDAVAFDPALKRIYATGLSGSLSVVEERSADAYALIDTVATHFGAHTLAVDPASHRLYVGYASLGLAPRIAVFSAIP